MYLHRVWTDLRQSSIDTVKTDKCKHAWYADDNWLQLISILEQSGGHTSPKDAVLSQWSNPKKVASQNSCMRRDRIVVSTSRCGRDNPGSNPGHGNAFICHSIWVWVFTVWHMNKTSCILKKSIASYKICADSEKSCLCDQVGYVIK